MPNGQYCQVNTGTACDLSVMGMLFKNTIEASRILGVDEVFRRSDQFDGTGTGWNPPHWTPFL